MADQAVATSNSSDETIVCYAPTMITTNGIWQGDNPLDYSLPLFVLQLTLVVVTTRILVYILKPFRQPRVISEILVSEVLHFLPLSFCFSLFFFMKILEHLVSFMEREIK